MYPPPHIVTPYAHILKSLLYTAIDARIYTDIDARIYTDIDARIYTDIDARIPCGVQIPLNRLLNPKP